MKFQKLLAVFLLTLSAVLIMGLLLVNLSRDARAERARQNVPDNAEIATIGVTNTGAILESTEETYEDLLKDYRAQKDEDSILESFYGEVVTETPSNPHTEQVPDESEEDLALKTPPMTADGRMYAVAEDPFTYRVKPSAPGAVTIAFAGDILMDPGYATMARMRQNGGTIEGVIDAPMLSLMRAADVMMVNNEFPFTDRGAPLQGKQFTFHAKTEWVKYLNDMGVDIAGLANNHAYDYGEIGLTDTLDTIRSAGIVTVGAGRNFAEAAHPVYLKATDPVSKQEFTISIVAATQIERYNNPHTVGATENKPGVFRCYDVTALLEQVRMAKATSDYCIVFIHWGSERMVESDWAQNAQAPQIVEAGADLIIGAHPHILQKIEYIGNTPVVYSLGNYWFNSSTLNTCLVTATITKDGLFDLHFIPAIQKDCTVNYAEGEAGQRIINYMNSLSTNATISPDGKILPRTQ
ncbi:MAG: CapA family protein [Lachnospiraceae bacterium]|nr:CapA family protein [Lachnospiraceae bacterium]